MSERFILFTHIKKEIAFFADDSRAVNSYSVPLDEMLKRLETKITDNVKQLSKNIDRLQILDKDKEYLTEEQDNLKLKRGDIIKKQEFVGKYLMKLNNQNFSTSIVFNDKASSLNISGSYASIIYKEDIKTHSELLEDMIKCQMIQINKFKKV